MTEPVIDAERRTLPSLTSLRWYAALIVFLLHLNEAPFHWTPLNPFGFGYTGVAFFFVLSGFVLCWSAPVVALSAAQFYRRRFARIYPSHIVMFGVAGVVALAIARSRQTGIGGAAMNVTLTQAWWPGYRMVETWNAVGWSLSVEAFFYLCFPAVLWWMRRTAPRTGSTVVALTLALGLSAMLLLRHRYGLEGAATAFYNPLARLPEFLLGVWLAVMLRRRWLRVSVSMWFPLALTAALAVLSWRKLLPYYPVADYAMLPAFALLIVVGANRDRAGSVGIIDRLLRHRISVYLGELSFAFYLVHTTAITVLWKLAGWAHPWGTAAGLLPAACALLFGLLLAAALHHGVEKPARKRLMKVATARRDLESSGLRRAAHR